MPSAPAKLIKIFGARVKLETTYATAVVPAATDAVLLAENPTLAVSYANDGKRPAPPGTLGNLKAAAPSGRTGETTLKVEPKGYGAAYSASNLPAGHALLRAAGLDAAIVTTGAAETVTYTPTAGPTGFASVSAGLYGRGQEYDLVGVLADWSLGANGPEIPMLEFPIKGLLPTISDIALPTMTYGNQATVMPPKSVGIAFSFNSVTSLVVKSWSLKMGRVINPRLDQNAASGHAGFAGAARVPTFEFTVENVALATVDFYALRDAATAVVISLTVGSAQYNKYTLSMPVAQVMDVTDDGEDPVATLKVTCQLNPSVVGANDEFSLLFN